MHSPVDASSKKNKKPNHKPSYWHEKNDTKKITPATTAYISFKERVRQLLHHENIFIAGGLVVGTIALIILNAPSNKKEQENKNTEVECPICLDSAKEIVKHNKKLLSLPCHPNHTCCLPCLERLCINKNKECPLCRTAIPDTFFNEKNISPSQYVVNENAKNGTDQGTQDFPREQEGENWLQYL